MLSVLPLASPPTNLPLEESYFKNLPSTFAVSSSTSSSFKRLTSPDPGPCERTLYKISLTCLISPLRSSILVSSEFSISSLIFVSSINLIACATVSLIFGVLIGSGLTISTISNDGLSSASSISNFDKAELEVMKTLAAVLFTKIREIEKTEAELEETEEKVTQTV